MFGSHLKRDWRAKKCSSIKTTRRPTSRPLQWQNYELGYELIPHPPYFPDLAPCDFFLFSNLIRWEEILVKWGSHCRRQWVFCRLWDSLLQMTKRELCVLSGWNLAWRDSKSGSFEMSRHQMDFNTISWKFTKLIKRSTYYFGSFLNIKFY